MGESILSPRGLVRTENTIKALTLRKAGVSLAQIAKEIGMANASGPWKLIKRALDELRKECKEEADDLRQLQLERLNDMLTIYWAKMHKNKDPETGRLIVKILERIDKLMGLEAPIKMEPVLPPVLPKQTSYDVDISKLSLEKLAQMRSIITEAGIEVIENDNMPSNTHVAQAILDSESTDLIDEDDNDDKEKEDL